MNISIIAPGNGPIPPFGWGAVENIIFEYQKALTNAGHTVQVINLKDKNKIITEVNNFMPDFVHCQYDEHVDTMDFIECPNKAITSHFGYLEQVWGFPSYLNDIHKKIIKNETLFIFCLSNGIADVYRKSGVDERRIRIVPNGVTVDEYLFSNSPMFSNKSAYVAKIDYRKRQGHFQSLSDIDFIGNLCPHSATASGFKPAATNYLGEWSRDALRSNLTHYANLILLSDGEAHPLVCLEGLAAGLGLVVSEYATANLDLSKIYIDVIPEALIDDLDYVSKVIKKNRITSLENRKLIRQDAREYLWSSILEKYQQLIEEIVKTNVLYEPLVLPSRNSKILIFTVALGNYFDAYMPAFTTSMSKVLFKDYDVKIVCFTDAKLSEAYGALDNTELVEVRNIGWPFSTLLRYELINNYLRENYLDFDTMVYIDADMKAVDKADPSLLTYDLFAVEHPGYINRVASAPFENIRWSSAYNGEFKTRYFQGCFWGGKAAPFSYIISKLRNLVLKDLNKNFIPIWHDESYLNVVANTHAFTPLEPSYAFPESSNLSYRQIIIHLKKDHLVMRKLSNLNNQLVELDDIYDIDRGSFNLALFNTTHKILQECNENLLAAKVAIDKINLELVQARRALESRSILTKILSRVKKLF